ncbi:DUF397 domain-containing protein [Spirillospora sp. NPDC127200]
MTSESPHLLWRKSSRSAQGANCVETAVLRQAHLVRDSKAPDGLFLSLTRAAWADFIGRVKGGEHDLR